jgi:DNA polymerase III delta subunit
MGDVELRPVYLITGTDAPKAVLAVRRLRARFEAGSAEELNGAQGASGDDVVAALNALGLFGGARLVVVREVDRWKAADVQAITTYLDAPAPGSVLALVGDPPRAGGLEQACARVGEVLRFDVPVRPRGRRLDYPAWVRAQFERHGVRADQETARALVELVGEDAFALQGEVDKLVTWAGGEQIGPEEVAAVAAPTAEASGFAFVDAWGARDTGATLAASEAMLEREEAFVLGLRLAGQVARTRTARRVLDRDGGLADVMKAVDAKEYPAKKAIDQADRYTAAELDRAAIRLARLDHDLKGGSRLSSELELARAIVDLTAPGHGEP